MMSHRIAGRAGIILLAAWAITVTSTRASEGQENKVAAASKKSEASSTAGASSAISCEKMGAAILAADVSKRLSLAQTAIRRACRPAPAPLWDAIRTGQWSDSAPLAPAFRVSLLVLMIGKRYAEAESLGVQLLEGNGHWPADGAAFNQPEAVDVISSLKSALTPYRIRLLLDIYDQVSDTKVRLAVVRALQESKSDEAMLAVVSACWDSTDEVKTAGEEAVKKQPEKSADGVLARLIRQLPAGPVLDGAVRLAKAHSGPEVQAALAKRGLK